MNKAIESAGEELKHCADCDPSFCDCWNGQGYCRKKPLPRQEIRRYCQNGSALIETLNGAYCMYADVERFNAAQSQQLAAAQARIAELEESTKNAEIECGLQILDASDQRKRVAVLEKTILAEVESDAGEVELIRSVQRWHNDNVIDDSPVGDWHAECIPYPEKAQMFLRRYINAKFADVRTHLDQINSKLAAVQVKLGRP